MGLSLSSTSEKVDPEGSDVHVARQMPGLASDGNPSARRSAGAGRASPGSTAGNRHGDESRSEGVPDAHASQHGACESRAAEGAARQDEQEGGGRTHVRGWAVGGPGPPAARLLWRLRWSTLGPQFDWTARVYDAHAPYRPLPPELRALAVRLSSVVAALELRPAPARASSPERAGASGSESAEAAYVDPEGEGSTREEARAAGAADSRGRRTSSGETSTHEGRSADSQRQSSSARPSAAVQAREDSPNRESMQHDAQGACHSGSRQGDTGWGAWEPDVALVNYYREGDTLGGHKDDAEDNMDAPIVALSLGCDAVFLLGGVPPAVVVLMSSSGVCSRAGGVDFQHHIFFLL